MKHFSSFLNTIRIKFSMLILIFIVLANAVVQPVLRAASEHRIHRFPAQVTEAPTTNTSMTTCITTPSRFSRLERAKRFIHSTVSFLFDFSSTNGWKYFSQRRVKGASRWRRVKSFTWSSSIKAMGGREFAAWSAAIWWRKASFLRATLRARFTRR